MAVIELEKQRNKAHEVAERANESEKMCLCAPRHNSCHNMTQSRLETSVKWKETECGGISLERCSREHSSIQHVLWASFGLELFHSEENELRTKISGNHIARDVRVRVSAWISGRRRESEAQRELPEGAAECISRERKRTHVLTAESRENRNVAEEEKN